jgi:c-di-GMP-binding flagellar brake protein YcgR
MALLRGRRDPAPKAKDTPARAARPESPLVDADSVSVRETTQVLRLLSGLRDGHCIVSVCTPDSDELFNSALLESRGGDGLTLDELTPGHGNRRRQPGDTLLCFSRLDGLSVRFETRITAVEVQDGAPLYHCQWPTEVFHGQKRSHYRVRIGLGLKVPLILSNQEDRAINGELRDLSIGGLGASFPEDTPVASGQQIPACWLELPDSGAIFCGLEIRHVSRDPQHRELRVGAAFTDLTPAQERAVQRCITALERERRRRETRDLN